MNDKEKKQYDEIKTLIYLLKAVEVAFKDIQNVIPVDLSDQKKILMHRLLDYFRDHVQIFQEFSSETDKKQFYLFANSLKQKISLIGTGGKVVMTRGGNEDMH